MTPKKEDVTLKEIVNNDAQRKKCCLCKFADSTEIMTFYSTLKNGQIRHPAFKIPSGILSHSMTEMKAFFTSGFNTLKIRSIVLRLAFRISAKKVIHCSVISYK